MQIGDLSFDAMNGSPERGAQAVEAIAPRPGEDYSRYRRLGRRAAVVEIRTAEISDDDPREYYLALRGTVVTITDALDNEWPDCMILDVRIEAHKAVIHNNTGRLLTQAVWTVQMTDDDADIEIE